MSRSRIEELRPAQIFLNDTLVSHGKHRIQPLGFHYNQSFVYMGDTETDILYRTTAESHYELEITVNTRQAEGKARRLTHWSLRNMALIINVLFSNMVGILCFGIVFTWVLQDILDGLIVV